MRTCITYGLFPLWFTAALVSAFYLYGTGIRAEWIVVGIGLSTGFVVAIAERIHPAHDRWNQSHGDVGTDAIHVVVSQAAIPALMESLIAAIVLHLSVSATAWLGYSIWPESWPLVC